LQSASGAVIVTLSPAFAVDGFTEKDGEKQGGSPFPEEEAHPDAAPTSRMTPTATKTGMR
jgi:hypothetical protein